MAAGATVARDRLEEFRLFLTQALEPDVAATRGGDALTIDGLLSARAASVALVRGLESAGPYGQGNPEPLIALPEHRVVDAAIVGAAHVRVRLQAGDGARLDAIAFRAVQSPLGEALLSARGESLHIAAQMSVGFFRGAEKVETRIVDAARPARGFR